LNWPWFWIFITYSFVIRLLCAARFSPESLFVFFIRERVKIKPQYEPGPTKRFAVFVASCFSVAYLILRFAFQLKEISAWVAGTLFIFVSLETLFGYCAACTMFAMGMLVGLLPKSTCEQCKILFVAVDEWEGAYPLTTTGLTNSATSKRQRSSDDSKKSTHQSSDNDTHESEQKKSENKESDSDSDSDDDKESKSSDKESERKESDASERKESEASERKESDESGRKESDESEQKSASKSESASEDS